MSLLETFIFVNLHQMSRHTDIKRNLCVKNNSMQKQNFLTHRKHEENPIQTKLKQLGLLKWTG